MIHEIGHRPQNQLQASKTQGYHSESFHCLDSTLNDFLGLALEQDYVLPLLGRAPWPNG